MATGPDGFRDLGKDPRRALLLLAALGTAAFAAIEFGAAGDLYQGFFQPQADPVGIPLQELAFDAYYLAYGLTFALALAVAVHQVGGARLDRAFRRAVRWRALPALLIGATGLGAAAVRFFLLQRQVITDDEEVYLFAARTLLEGRVANPLPDAVDLYRNQFVVLNEHGWFGKYPIGHSVVLAGALAVRLLDWVMPALAVLTAWVTWRLGRLAVGPRRALGGLALLALSPHFVWTHGTLLSQPTSCAGAMVGFLALAAWRRRPRAWLPWAAGAGFAVAFFARPMPGAPALALGAIVLLFAARQRRRSPWVPGLGLGVPALVAVGLTGLVNYAQSGNPLTSGYHQVHGTLGVGGDVVGAVGLSVFGGLIRENFWLFGWPLSLLPLLAARPARRGLLLWTLPVAVLAYRVAVPKTVVSTTGPTYLMEAVPMLVLLAADGLARLRILVRRALGDRARGAVAACVVGATVAAWSMYLPVEAAAARAGSDARLTCQRLLERGGVTRAVVFADFLVRPDRSVSWAYFPPSPSPDLSDEVIYLRRSKVDRMRDYAQRKFPDRPAFVFVDAQVPELMTLYVYAQRVAGHEARKESRRNEGGKDEPP